MSNLTARPYQARAVAQMRQAYRDGHRRICLVSPTGSGKTFMASMLADRAVERGRVCWIVHRRELVQQARCVLPGDVRVVTIQELVARNEIPEADVVFLDECVAPWTRVGSKRADALSVGDTVPSWDGTSVVPGRVTATMRKTREGPLVDIIVGSRVLSVTSNHPVWVEGAGYVEAIKVREGDLCRVWVTGSELRPEPLRENVRKEAVPEGNPPTASAGLCRMREASQMAEGARVAQDVFEGVPLCCPLRYGNRDEQAIRYATDEDQQPDEESGGAGKGVEDAQGHWAQAASPGREREADAFAPAASSRRPWGWVGVGARREHGRQESGAPRQLQDRHRGPSHYDCGGGRWGESRGPVQERCGQTQGPISALARVDRVEVHERGCSCGCGYDRSANQVYDFTVEPHHNYFADGVLVHNCHHYVADEWGQVASGLDESTAVIGLTATPERSDGRPLGDLFSSMVVAAQYSELLEGGWIAPCDVIAPADSRSSLSCSVPEAVRKYAGDRKTLVFVNTVKAAVEAASEIDGAAVLTGETPKADRDIMIGKFLNGELRRLVNVYVLTEGFDCPDADVAVLARGCSHASTYLQIVGRVLRPAPGKDRALLVDLTGVVHKHGWPTDDRAYSLEGRAIKRKVDDPVTVWQCRFCGMCFPTPPRDRRCESCGKILPEPEPLKVQRRRMEMRKREEVMGQHEKDAVWRRLVGSTRRKGYKLTRASVIYKQKFGTWRTDYDA